MSLCLAGRVCQRRVGGLSVYGFMELGLIPVVGALVDDSYDVDVPDLSGLRECETSKPTVHLAEEWNVTPVRFMSEAGDEQVTEPPATPTGLTAVATNGQVVLTWDDPGDDSITGYRILRRMRRGGNYGNWITLETHTGSAATTYTDDTVVGNVKYAYRIIGHQRATGSAE